VIHQNGGIVQGQLLVLDLQLSTLDEWIEWLWEREGNPPRELLKQMECNGFGRVLYCELESNLTAKEINPESLARFAIESVDKRDQSETPVRQSSWSNRRKHRSRPRILPRNSVGLNTKRE
jgi:hypothetical protein